MMGLLGGTPLDFLPEDEQKRAAAKMGLLNFGAQMLSNATQGFGGALGAGLLGGVQGYQGAMQDQQQNVLRNAQIDQFKAKTGQEKQRQEAFSRISAGYSADPSFKPAMSDLMLIDPDSVVKGMMPGGGVDYGLEPKVGLNPSTGKPAYFIQDKRGGTKWLDAGVPQNLQYIKGDEYRPGQLFDPRQGTVTNVANPFGNAPAQVAEAAPVDPNAPWAKLTSPKEQDQMRARVYDQDGKRLDELRQRVTQGRSVMKDLARFGELNQQQATGGILDRQSWLPTTDPEKREMEAIVARLAPNQRPAGSGTTSDKDIALYLQGLPGIDKPGDVNRNIRLQYETQLKDAEDALKFQEQYFTEKGHLTGVDAAYQAYKQGGKAPASAPIAPSVSTAGGWESINSATRTTQPARDAERLAILQSELANERDPQLRAALEREIKNAGGNVRADAKPTKPAANAFEALPAPVKYKGKTAVDQQTGKRYKSNGMQWVEVK